MSSFLSIKALLEEHVPLKEIARRLGRDVRTVRAWARRIRKGEDLARRPAREGNLLDPFRDRVGEMAGRGMTAVQIHGALVKLPDFAASYSSVRRLVRRLRQRQPEVFCRMRYAPGEEAQVDFAEIGRVACAGRSVRAWMFVLTLCYSRVSYYEIVLDQTVPTFLGALRRALEFLGGVPGRLKLDNLRAGVLIDQLGRRYYQEDFFRFCHHYGTVADAARPYTPTDKGRVERDIRYCRGSHFRGRDLGDLEAEQAALVDWRDTVANVRLHGTTQRRPVDLFAEERASLRPLPADAYEVATWGQYRVRKDCHVAVLGNYFSVPYRFVGQDVLVRVTEKEVGAFAAGERVANHPRPAGRGHTVTDVAHYPPHHREATHEVHRRRVLQVRAAGPFSAEFLGRAADGRYVLGDQLRRLVALLEEHGATAFERSCERALHFGAVDSLEPLERILAGRHYEQPLSPEPAARPPEAGEQYERPLAEYGELLKEDAAA